MSKPAAALLAMLIGAQGVANMGACALPEGDQSTPTQLHYKWVAVRAAGDVDQMWELLHADVRNEFERWLTAEKIMVNEIKTGYPKEDAQKALDAIGGAERGELDSPKALFKRFVRATPEAPGMLGEIGARVKSEDIADDGKSATIRTFGGDEAAFLEGAPPDDDKWYATLAGEEALRLKNARVRAEQNLARVRANLDKLGRNK